ncbi:hypothetical protein [Corynebacterium gallinarum]|uniref:Uncharacterized protein n=1 Tax=Corynebacterium gallinarum TaxID=2762214 RepID=A0A8I0LHM9_9CORY|nr:hypothetical protein [Corynebacterium gallinarum]MBD8031415.1 hypothetical protein [Corynebacterium gallinarum]
MAPRIIPLPTAALQQFFPNDEHLNPSIDGIVYTLENPHAFGGNVPAYEDPAHLAAWLHGFATMNNLIIEQTDLEKGN